MELLTTRLNPLTTSLAPYFIEPAPSEKSTDTSSKTDIAYPYSCDSELDPYLPAFKPVVHLLALHSFLIACPRGESAFPVSKPTIPDFSGFHTINKKCTGTGKASNTKPRNSEFAHKSIGSKLQHPNYP